MTRDIAIPGDKSISHRALMLAALGDGPSTLRGVLPSADVRSTANVLGALGVAVPAFGHEMVVRGRGLRNLAAPAQELECGNSGTTARLMAGIVAAHPFRSRLVGDASLSRRPMRRIAAPLQAMGATVTSERADGLPLDVAGRRLTSVEWSSATASAQVKSAVLLAALVAGVDAAVVEPAQSRDHTERMLVARGVDMRVAGNRVEIAATSRLEALDTRVPSDPSSAAFFAALAALDGRGPLVMRGVCVNPTRDGFLRALDRMGAAVARRDARDEGGEPIADVEVRRGALRGIEVAPADVPAMIDELPLLACVAAMADGETRVTGAQELRVKESDRIAVVVDNLRRVGADADALSDGFVVAGGAGALRGRVETHGDHRIAMAFGILGAVPGNEIVVDDRGCADVSFPGFWEALARATAGAGTPAAAR